MIVLQHIIIWLGIRYFVISPIGSAAGIVIRQSLFRLSLAPVLYLSSLFHSAYLQITFKSEL